MCTAGKQARTCAPQGPFLRFQAPAMTTSLQGQRSQVGSEVSKEPGRGSTGVRGGRAGVQGHPRILGRRLRPRGVSGRKAIFKMGATYKLVSNSLLALEFPAGNETRPGPSSGGHEVRPGRPPRARAHLHEQVKAWAGGQRPAANQTPPALWEPPGPLDRRLPGRRHRGRPQPSARFLQADSHPVKRI